MHLWTGKVLAGAAFQLLTRFHKAICLSDRRKFWSCGLISVTFLLFYPSSAYALDLDQLGDAILSREIELETLNEKLHLETTRPMYSREKRTWLWDFANAVPTEGGLIAATALFSAHANDKPGSSPNVVPGAAIAGTLIPQIAGQVFGGTGSFFELGLRYSHSRRIHRLHLDRRSITEHAQIITHQIDDLEDEFEHQAQAAQSKNAQIYLAELKVLQSLKHLALSRYRYLEGQSLGIATGNTIEDASSVIRNSIGTIGNSLNTAAVLNNNRLFNGQASILNLIAASMITIRPLASTMGAYTAKKLSASLCLRAFPQLDEFVPEDSFRQSFADLKMHQAENSSTKLQTRIALYEVELKNIAEQENLASFETNDNRRVIFNRLRETFYGPTKMTQSIMGVSNGLRKANNPAASNRLSAASNTVYTAGQAYNIAELLRQRIAEDKKHACLKQELLLPEERIARSISAYDSMASQLRHD